MVNQERLVNIFMELVKVDSETRNEGKFQSYLKDLFTALDVEVYEDNSMETTGYGANNLLCRIPGNSNGDAIFFSSHMDTVTPGVGIKPILKEGAIYSDGTTILGADDKAGIAAMIELTHQLKEEKMNHGTIEFLLTVGEESGLIGAKAFDYSLMKSNYGFVLDSLGAVGGVVVKTPTHYGLNIKIKGITAHAGVEPEKGLSALAIAVEAMKDMKLGRIDEETTANIGVIKGGTANNVVMEEVELTAEARSISKEACEAQVEHMVQKFVEASKKLGGSVEIKKDKMYEGFQFSKDQQVVHIADLAIQSIGRETLFEASGGGSDANIFNENNKETVNLAIGYEGIHTVSERMPVVELVKTTELAMAIVEIVNKRK